MSCSDRMDELLCAWLDGELSAGEDTELRAHLSVCEACSRYADQLRADRQLFVSVLYRAAAAARCVTPSAVVHRRRRWGLELRPGRRREAWLVGIGLTAGIVVGLLMVVALARSAGRVLDVGTVITTSGEASIGPSGGPLQPLARGTVITAPSPVVLAHPAGRRSALQELRTGADASVLINTPQGSRIDVGPDSELVFVKPNYIRLAAGRLTARVYPPNLDSEFVIATTRAEFAVRGTRYTVMASPDFHWLVVWEGRVLVRRPSMEDVVVSASENPESRPAAATVMPSGQVERLAADQDLPSELAECAPTRRR